MNKFIAVVLTSCFIFPLLFGLSAQESIPEKPPAKIPYKITRTYPHSPGSFTQGFVFEDGYLY